jgi:hypothetical protein
MGYGSTMTTDANGDNVERRAGDAEGLLGSITHRLTTGWSLHNPDGGRIPGYWIHWSGPVEIMSWPQVNHFDAAFRAAHYGRRPSDGE